MPVLDIDTCKTLNTLLIRCIGATKHLTLNSSLCHFANFLCLMTDFYVEKVYVIVVKYEWHDSNFFQIL